MAAEDETTAVGRRGGSGRGRKQPIGKKDPNNHSAGNKKNSDIVKTIYSSDENSSEVGLLTKLKLANIQYIFKIVFHFRRIGPNTKSRSRQRREKKLLTILTDSINVNCSSPHQEAESETVAMTRTT